MSRSTVKGQGHQGRTNFLPIDDDDDNEDDDDED